LSFFFLIESVALEKFLIAAVGLKSRGSCPEANNFYGALLIAASGKCEF